MIELHSFPTFERSNLLAVISIEVIFYQESTSVFLLVRVALVNLSEEFWLIF
jgi:hypothetical protein